MSPKDDPYTLRILERVREVPAATWDGMLGEESSPFVEHAWLDMLEETGCVGDDTGWAPAHLSLWRGEKLVAVAPSYVKGHSEGEFVFDWSWADLANRMGSRYYPKVVLAVPFTPATGDRVLTAPGEDRALMTRLLAGAARQWCGEFKGGGVHVLFPRDEPEVAKAFEESGYLRREGFQFHWFRHADTTFDAYLGRFTSKQRNQIKRELRGVAERGVTVETLPPEQHTRALARTMHGFYASTIENHGMWGRMYLRESFFEAVVERFRDRLAWVVAREKDGTPVGGAFNVVKGRRLYGRYWGASVQMPYLHFVVCYYAGIRYCIERGLDVFEPGAGGEHKRARGFVPTLTRSFHWLADGRMRRVIGPHLELERARVRAHVASEGQGDGDLTDS
ncbi:MAG: GNAT family N-acetyltransferase [Polyangiaceae bacterium]